MAFDFHLHLQDPRFARAGGDPRILLPRLAAEAGVRGCCCCATCPADWGETLSWYDGPSHDGAWHDGTGPAPLRVEAALGVHPWFAAEVSPGWAEELAGLLVANPAACVGEAGLDGVRDDVPPERQRDVLGAQLDIAVRLGRGVVLHGARAWGELADAVRPYAAKLPFVACHAFGGSRETMRDWLRMGAYLSFGGAVCNPRAQRVRAACAECPGERLLLETDAPDFLPPGAPPYPAENGAPLNHPGNLPLVARAAAGLRCEDPAALDAAVGETVARLFDRLTVNG